MPLSSSSTRDCLLEQELQSYLSKAAMEQQQQCPLRSPLMLDIQTLAGLPEYADQFAYMQTFCVRNETSTKNFLLISWDANRGVYLMENLSAKVLRERFPDALTLVQQKKKTMMKPFIQLFVRDENVTAMSPVRFMNSFIEKNIDSLDVTGPILPFVLPRGF